MRGHSRRLSVGLTVSAMLAALSVGLAPVASAAILATITVSSAADESPSTPDNGNCTLREAIEAANTNTAEDACPAGTGTGADVIVVPPGLYALTVAGGDENANQTGDLDVLEAVTIDGAGPGATIIDGGGIDRVLHVDPSGAGITVEIGGVTIRNGDDPDVDPQACGGGLFNLGVLTLRDVAVVGNEGGCGGGIVNGEFANLTLIDAVVADNRTDDPANGVGGGIVNQTATLTATNVTISGNVAQNSGGGIWNVGGGSTATLNNATVVQNTADADAAGSHNGGGIWNETGDVNMGNTIVAANIDGAGGEAPDCQGPVTSLGYNLLGNNAGCAFAATTGDQVGTPAAPIAPRVRPLADNGGPTATHALLKGSPAIDAANPASPGSGGTACAATDQRGVPRPEGAACDIGAYEYIECMNVVVNRVGTDSRETIVGTSGRDGVLGYGGKDRIRTRGGKDAVCAGKGGDTVRTGGGADKARGEEGKDLLAGGGGKDFLRGNRGNDMLKGGGGKDRLAGNIGDDRIVGGGGNDSCRQGSGGGAIRNC